MRQNWLAIWGSERYPFISIEVEAIARIALLLELVENNKPLPDTFTIERIGPPYDVRGLGPWMGGYDG